MCPGPSRPGEQHLRCSGAPHALPTLLLAAGATWRFLRWKCPRPHPCLHPALPLHSSGQEWEIQPGNTQSVGILQQAYPDSHPPRPLTGSHAVNFDLGDLGAEPGSVSEVPACRQGQAGGPRGCWHPERPTPPSALRGHRVGVPNLTWSPGPCPPCSAGACLVAAVLLQVEARSRSWSLSSALPPLPCKGTASSHVNC